MRIFLIVSYVTYTNFPASVMVLRVVCSEVVMPPHFFQQCLRQYAATYKEVLERVVKPWINGERPYVFQQDTAPTQKSVVTQNWMEVNLHDDITPTMWSSNSPDLNPCEALLNPRLISVPIIRLIPANRPCDACMSTIPFPH